MNMANNEVCARMWTDEWCPTAPASMSPRQAALEILSEIDWGLALDELTMWHDMDPFVYYGLRSVLSEARWLDGRPYMSGKTVSHLAAWATSRMGLNSWCLNEDHHDDMISFNYCDGDDSPCEWEWCWALKGYPEDFLALAMVLIRDGWEPEVK